MPDVQRRLEDGVVAYVVAGTVLLIDDQRPVAVPGAHVPLESRAATAGIGMPIVGHSPAKIGVVQRKTRVEHGGKLIPASLPFGAPGPACVGSHFRAFASGEAWPVTRTNLETGRLTFHRVVDHG